jgi:hypothetical protein
MAGITPQMENPMVSTLEQLDEAIAGVSLELTAEQRERLDPAV